MNQLHVKINSFTGSFPSKFGHRFFSFSNSFSIEHPRFIYITFSCCLNKGQGDKSTVSHINYVILLRPFSIVRIKSYKYNFNRMWFIEPTKN